MKWDTVIEEKLLEPTRPHGARFPIVPESQSEIRDAACINFGIGPLTVF